MRAFTYTDPRAGSLKAEEDHSFRRERARALKDESERVHLKLVAGHTADVSPARQVLNKQKSQIQTLTAQTSKPQSDRRRK